MKSIIKKILKEEFEEESINWDIIDFEDGEVKCYHYSYKSFDGYVSTKGVPGLQSKLEYRTWGQNRAFFYLTENGRSYDKGISDTYKYISYIPLNEIYDITKNSNGYRGNWSEIYKQSSEDGYTSWVYNLGGNRKVPILISFKPVKIAEKYKKLPSGMYKLEGEELEDEVVGKIFKNNREMLVLQRNYYPKHMSNLFAILPSDLNKKIRYEATIEYFERKNINFFEKYINQYID